MGLHAMDPLIGPAERAERRLDILHEGKRDPCLASAGLTADRAQFADSGQCAIQRGHVGFSHSATLSISFCTGKQNKAGQTMAAPVNSLLQFQSTGEKVSCKATIIVSSWPEDDIWDGFYSQDRLE